MADKYRLAFLTVAFIGLLSGSVWAQQKPNIYINCATSTTRCYQDYLLQSLYTCNFVRDASSATIQVLVTEKPNSQGGYRINFEFTGMNELVGKKDTIFFDLPQGQTEEYVRSMIVTHLSKGLSFLLHHTAFEKAFDAKVNESFVQADSGYIENRDLWKGWNFTAAFEGYMEGQSNYLYYNVGPKIAIRKITPKHKLVVNIQQGFKKNSYTIDEIKQSILIKSLDIIPLYARSINEHWSVGGIMHYRSSEYSNIKSSIRIAPLLEYNLFPYSKNTIKQIRFVYQAGVQSFDYYGESIWNKIQETLPYQRLAILTDVTRNWGSIRGSVQSSSYLNDLTKNRLSFVSECSFRLAKGLFFNITGQFEMVNDQISLLKNPLDETTYLLGGQQLATKNNFWAEFGISYNFGSKYTSIVNPRMGSLDEVWFQNK